MYYTTSEVKEIFGWKSNNTMHIKKASGFMPEPDLPGSPNKWLKSKIDAIVNAPNSGTTDQKNDA
ncbi:hypothetical protein [Psychrobacter sp.]|uniref:hypothetical protein n=1 Tax=Psychrobacter sp. TaxID=56811 RepID=UPI003566694C